MQACCKTKSCYSSHVKNIASRPSCKHGLQAHVHSFSRDWLKCRGLPWCKSATIVVNVESALIAHSRNLESSDSPSTSGADPAIGRERTRWEALDPGQRCKRGLAAFFVASYWLCFQLALAPPSTAVLSASSPDIDTLQNVPTQLGSTGEAAAVPLSSVVSGPKKREIEGCTRKCVPTCIRGGEGLGPISVRKELVVFKEGFRSRQYCLSECVQVCALSFDKDKAAQLGLTAVQ